jgi:predicted aspartyl protease
MGARPFVLAIVFFLAFAMHAHAIEDSLSPAPAPEEVVVAAPEPRYVAPTLRDRIGRVWAPVYLNGVGPFRLVLDTGANRSAVTRSVASRIGAPIVDSQNARLLGATGTSIVPAIYVDSIEVGDLLLDRSKVVIVDDVFGGAEGVLGADGLGDKRVFIDFRNDAIDIRQARSRSRPPDYARVRVKRYRDHLLMFDVTLAGVRTTAMLDTGAQTTIGNTKLRQALERRARRGVENRIVGVTLDEQIGLAFDAPPVTIADVTVRGMRVTFGDFHIFDAWKMNDRPALLIGMDIIGLLDSLIIDYKHQELLLRAAR